jgi:hypothetical protein
VGIFGYGAKKLGAQKHKHGPNLLSFPFNDVLHYSVKQGNPAFYRFPKPVFEGIKLVFYEKLNGRSRIHDAANYGNCLFSAKNPFKAAVIYRKWSYTTN